MLNDIPKQFLSLLPTKIILIYTQMGSHCFCHEILRLECHWQFSLTDISCFVPIYDVLMVSWQAYIPTTLLTQTNIAVKTRQDIIW